MNDEMSEAERQQAVAEMHELFSSISIPLKKQIDKMTQVIEDDDLDGWIGVMEWIDELDIDEKDAALVLAINGIAQHRQTCPERVSDGMSVT